MATDSDQQRGPDSRTGSSDSEETSIELRNLRKTFAGGSIIAVDDVDVQIDSDEFVVLVGPSGCGKTTTLRCISGLEQPDSGNVIINGRDVTYDQPKDRNLAFVFQDIALFPHMTVRENMRFGLDQTTDLSGEQKEERVREAADMLGLGGTLDRSPAELSGGQQQRVSIGRAMVTEPAAFLLDEPFSDLDANLRDQMQTEVKQLQRNLETAMVFVTHDQEEAMTLGDKIIVMNDGDIMQRGSPYDIYNEPANQFVAEFIGSPSTNFFECVVQQRGDDLVLASDIFTAPLDGALPDSLSNGDKITLAIRPEHLDLESDTPLFDATIDVIEPHGTNDAIYLSSDGTELSAVSEQNRFTTEDSSLAIGFEEEHVWLFDDEGERVR